MSVSIGHRKKDLSSGTREDLIRATVRKYIKTREVQNFGKKQSLRDNVFPDKNNILDALGIGYAADGISFTEEQLDEDMKRMVSRGKMIPITRAEKTYYYCLDI